jgi:hypothetical protein
LPFENNVSSHALVADVGGGARRCVVAVVGDAHVAGMQRMWASGQWVGLLSDALSAPPPPPSVAAAPQPATASQSAGFQDVEEEEKPAPGSFFQDVQEEEGGRSSSAGRPSAAEKPNAGVKVRNPKHITLITTTNTLNTLIVWFRIVRSPMLHLRIRHDAHLLVNAGHDIEFIVSTNNLGSSP